MYQKKKKVDQAPTLKQVYYRCKKQDRFPQCVKAWSESMGIKLGRRGLNYVLVNDTERIDTAVEYAVAVWGNQ